ncbi:hypothetical protein [Agromyces laixinhei]|uniref:hypothetical protein n=1 Tax=Agromyces laixinhei TaxID=2585717 RepID=UPI00143D9CB4|nr:hypothetical protein [Agromyces laixinhei]
MKILDLTLNAVIALTAAVFLAYIGLFYWDYGIFVTLPAEITDFFVRNGFLQYVMLALFLAAMIAKIPVGRAIKQHERTNRN